MAFRTILVPVDGSELSSRALGFAIERARANAAEIVAAFVVNRLSVAIATATPYAYVDPTPLLETLDAEAEVVLSAAESLVRKAGIPIARAELDGAAASEILEYARRSGADLIVMGSHGRRGHWDRFFGQKFCFGYRARQHLVQLRGLDRLGQTAREGRPGEFRAVAGYAHGCQQHQGQVFPARQATDLFGQLHAIHARHLHVQNREVEGRA